ncbi:ABC-type Fe3+-hydroxamate transport system substrate-binding protein [Paenibacillus sp. 4624]|uniref:helix-turn-helix domain-containing protein n=1 Tax=Paenibacillus sp. 4624 TaxID=3156453 RepID=UPI003D249AAD
MESNDWIKRLEQLYLSSVHICQYAGIPGQAEHRVWRRFAVCRVMDGRGTLTIDNVMHTVSRDDWFMLSPGMHVELQTDIEAPVRYQLILFSGVGLVRTHNVWRTEAFDFPITGKLKLSSIRRDIQEKMDRLFYKNFTGAESENIGKKYLVHQLLIQLMTYVQPFSQPQAGMDLAIDYMTHHYTKEIRIHDMARLAGLSVNHFIRSFKRQFGMTPIDYILKLRMNRAKQLLFSTDKIKMIAEQVGYKDEHYFSRVFKKNEGVAPAFYMKNKVSRIATLYYGLDDVVLTLGLKPVSALSYVQRVAHPTLMPAHQANSFQGLILDSSGQNYDKLKRLQPDLIITSDRMKPNESLHHIAPTAILKHTNQVGESLLYMADIMGRKEHAIRWIEQHADLSHVLQKRIHSEWGRQSAMFIRVSSQFYRMYGLHNQTGSLLYDDMGLHMPEDYPSEQWAVEMNINDVQLYNADHLFIMVDPTEEARIQLQRLLKSDEWMTCKAVLEGRVYDAGDIFFQTLGPTGRIRAMKYVAKKLGVALG